jgi:hypothetical protein
MPLPEAFRKHLQDLGYHPRSAKHSDALAEAIVADFLGICDPAAEQARSGRLVYDLNFDLRFGTSTWNVDLVLGVPASPVPPGGGLISRDAPATVRIAIEVKSVMTEHRKAVKNRKRDFEAHHEHVHNYDPRAIAAGVMVVNAAETFRSPLRPAATRHGDRARMAVLVNHCMTEMRNVTTSSGISKYGMDAKAAIVAELDNMGGPVRYVTTPPAPQPGDPLHYDSFLRRLCDEYTARFGSR